MFKSLVIGQGTPSGVVVYIKDWADGSRTVKFRQDGMFGAVEKIVTRKANVSVGRI